MQIHELTQHPLNEGFMDSLKNKTGTMGKTINSMIPSDREIKQAVGRAGKSIKNVAGSAATGAKNVYNKTASAVAPAVKSAASGVASAVTNNPATRAYDRSTGVLGKAPSYASTAQNAAQKLSKQGFGAQYQAPSADWQEKLKKVQTDPAVKQYIQSLASAWSKSAPALSKSAPAPAAAAPNYGAGGGAATAQLTGTPSSVTSTPLKTPAATPNYGAGGGAAQLTGTPSSVPSSVPSTPLNTPTAVNKTPTANQTIRVGGQKIDPNDPKNATTIAALRRQGAINETVSPDEDQYADAFISWGDEKLKTRESNTGETIEMNDVRELPGISDALNPVLEQIVNTRGTPQQAAAVAKYFEIAVAGVQAVAQAVRNKNPQALSGGIASAAAAKPVMQQRLRALGLTPAQIQKIGKMLQDNSGDKTFKSTNNPQVDALLMTLGMTPL